MKLYIKYMVSIRCKMLVKEELKKLGLHFVMVNLGEVEIMEDITLEQRDQLKAALLVSSSFTLILALNPSRLMFLNIQYF